MVEQMAANGMVVSSSLTRSVPAGTQRRFNVYLTLNGRYERQMNVVETSWDYFPMFLLAGQKTTTKRLHSLHCNCHKGIN